jgi:hypothetical protein
MKRSSGYCKSGAEKSLGLGLFLSSTFFCQNSNCKNAVIAALSLIAQLHSQGKLTTPRRENRKIGHEIEMLKANEPVPYV